jgi:hypothetical protein
MTSNESKHEREKSDALISRILDYQFSESGFSEIHPLIIHLGSEGLFHVMTTNSEKILSPGFAKFSIGVSSLVSDELNAKAAIIVLPCVRDAPDSLSIVSSIDLVRSQEISPYFLAIIDDGSSLRASVFSINGIPGRGLLSVVEAAQPSQSALSGVVEKWDLEGKFLPGILMSGNADEMEAEPGTFSWMKSSDSFPAVH